MYVYKDNIKITLSDIFYLFIFSLVDVDVK